MARINKEASEGDLTAILALVGGYPEGASRSELAEALRPAVAPRTLQFRLKSLIRAGRLFAEGRGRATRYRLPLGSEGPVAALIAGNDSDAREVFLSPASIAIQGYLEQPMGSREQRSYNREFLTAYRPNESFYLSAAERSELAEVGQLRLPPEEAAETYAKQILHRLLIDLSWNSSRLEGNTYSLLDTKRLLEFGEEVPGSDRLEAQMILNHKEAIEFLVGAREEIGFNRYTILNLHGILAQNLLPDEGAAGRLRRIAVGIAGSAFQPLGVPQMIEECFETLLAKAAAIGDPFEQAFFIMVQLPYLQPFDDVNKRVSRIAANIPFLQRNLSPLSFMDVPRGLYTEGVLGVYEENRVDLLKDVFLWAYRRSAARYGVVRQSLGEPDAFRMRHRVALRQIVAEVVRGRTDRRAASARVASFAEEKMTPEDRERFRELAESELLNLHPGNFARYQIRPSEFAAWEEVWRRPAVGLGGGG